MPEEFDLDDHARLALDVAQHAALANGDAHCGTEYLLYGLVATARGEIVELMELFALNTLRVDRAIERLMEQRHAAGVFESGPPILSSRARAALATPRLDNNGPTGPFELLHGLLADSDSGACHVLRGLGVQPEEALRLIAYGMRHLSKAEIDELIATLDRRSEEHMAWWGPNPTTQLRALRIDGLTPLTLAASESAVVELTAMGTDRNGFGFTVTTKSLRSWVLPPVFSPEEALVPGHGARYSDGPDFFLLQLILPDGSVLDNRRIEPRYALETPARPRLVRLGQRDERTTLNDRRRPDQHVITADWWAWPMPTLGSIEVRVDWPAESISGVTSFDSGLLLERL